MIAYQKEKIENAICFFAFEHKKKTRKPLSQTFLYKYLAFLDFKSLEETGQPALGLKYMAMAKGPVPIELYEKKDHLTTPCFSFKKISDKKYIIVPGKEKPNLDFFSPYEIKKMQQLIEIFADKFVQTKHASEASHQDIKAWVRAYNKKPNSIIDYSLQFDKKISLKPESELTYPEETYLTYSALESMAK